MGMAEVGKGFGEYSEFTKSLEFNISSQLFELNNLLMVLKSNTLHTICCLL